MVKGLIDRILPKERPKFYDDPFLELHYQKIEDNKRKQLTPRPNQIEQQVFYFDQQSPPAPHLQYYQQHMPNIKSVSPNRP